MTEDRFTTLEPLEAKAAADALIKAFNWSESYEGHGFWETVYERLIAIAASEDEPRGGGPHG